MKTFKWFSKFALCLLFILLATHAHLQSNNFRFKDLLQNKPDEIICTAVENKSPETVRFLHAQGILIKQITKEFIYVNMSPRQLAEAQKAGNIGLFHFELSSGQALMDTNNIKTHVKEVHQGLGNLPQAYTGQDIVIAYIDQGLDYNHPDFKDANGNTRVLRYWDQAMANTDPNRVPQPYGYGQVWYASEMQNGTALSKETSTTHGTTVTGAGSGNGLANGRHKGVAPDSKIIVIQTNLNANNWTLTVADACDYVFKVADSLGLPAVINLSVGTYLGSHDATDPAGVLIDNLLSAKPGRIIVAAAGNSGNSGKYHVEAVVNADTSFVWIKPNPSSQFGTNKIYFDLWADSTDAANLQFFFGANKASGSFQERGKTPMSRQAFYNLNQMTEDTIYNSNQQILATVMYFTSIQNGVYNMEVLFNRVDSAAYVYSFNTFGQGKYDLWSGTFLGLNEFVENVPSSSVYPKIIHYIQPNNEKTIVSSWTCSPKVVTVGNYNNYGQYLTRNGTIHGTPSNPEEISMNSSRGPNRRNHVKPDILAPGDLTLASSTMTLINNPSNAAGAQLDDGGMHSRNGGTSMSSPVVAGIAALYLEKCTKSTYQDFLNDIIASAVQDQYTGFTANPRGGNGKIHALNALERTNYAININGNGVLCTIPLDVTLSSNAVLNHFLWSDNSTNSSLLVSQAGSYSVSTLSNKGCKSSLNFTVTQGVIPAEPIITDHNTYLASDPQDNYQWHFNGTAIQGATSQNFFISMQSGGGLYTVSTTSTSGCTTFSEPHQSFLSVDQLESKDLLIYPNPTQGKLHLDSNMEVLKLTDIQGKSLNVTVSQDNTIDLSGYSSGIYMLTGKYLNTISTIKVILL